MKFKTFPTKLGPLIVTDDFAPAAVRDALSSIAAGPIWQYGWGSNLRRERFSYWHAHVAGGDSSSISDCEQEFSRNVQFSSAYAIFKLLQQGPLKGHAPVRVYLNAHTYGVEGYVHQDNKENDQYFSTVYYAHPVWRQNWSGETVFYSQDEAEILTSVLPRPGRAVTFPGAVPHCARAPSRDCSDLRVSLVIKTVRQQTQS